MDVDVDVDADQLQGRGLLLDERLTAVSERRFSVGRGPPRSLGLLREHEVPATFYVPGSVVERYPRPSLDTEPRGC